MIQTYNKNNLTTMLAKRTSDEAVTQRIICYATMILLLVYFMKFLKYMVRRSYCARDLAPAALPRPQTCSHVSKPCSHQADPCHKDEHKSKKPRRRRHHRYMPEQWLPRSNPSHNISDIYDE